MDINEKINLVIKAGVKLVESGLIARTWGNVSCRIDESSFLITPSGRNYINLTPEEIVVVRIEDCSYSGNVKPSSEKGIHAEVYKLFPEVNFVIHTHQENASALSATGLSEIKLSNDVEILCAKYALPGTNKLRRNVAEVLKSSKGNAVIMKNHGALCFGNSYEETFKTASELEVTCQNFLIEQYLKVSGSSSFNKGEMNHFSLAGFSNSEIRIPKRGSLPYQSSRRITGGFMLTDDKGGNTQVEFDEISSFLPREVNIYNSIYKKYKNIDYIINSIVPETVAVSDYEIRMKPLLDDFAQIAGTEAKNIPIDSLKIASTLKNSSVVFLRNHGALCCGKTQGDAEAVALVTAKACKALIAAALFGKVEPINSLECRLMRFVYLNKYSRQVDRGPK